MKLQACLVSPELEFVVVNCCSVDTLSLPAGLEFRKSSAMSITCKTNRKSKKGKGKARNGEQLSGFIMGFSPEIEFGRLVWWVVFRRCFAGKMEEAEMGMLGVKRVAFCW